MLNLPILEYNILDKSAKILLRENILTIPFLSNQKISSNAMQKLVEIYRDCKVFTMELWSFVE